MVKDVVSGLDIHTRHDTIWQKRGASRMCLIVRTQKITFPGTCFLTFSHNASARMVARAHTYTNHWRGK